MPRTPNRREIIAGLIAVAGTAAMARPGFTAASGGARATAWGRLGRLNKGFSLSGWADTGPAGAPDPALLEVLHHLGFATIRLPIDPMRLLGSQGERTVRHVVAAVRTAHAYGYSATLDMHPGADSLNLFGTDPQRAKGRIIAAWNRLVPAISDLPADQTFLELLNEPPLDPDVWARFRDRLGTQLRAACPAHTLIWGAARYQSIGESLDLEPMADPNTILAIHEYRPLSFTHQGADWSGPALAALHGVPFPATAQNPVLVSLRAELKASGNTEAFDLLADDFAKPWTINRVTDNFARIGAWSRTHDCPVVLNEFGVLDTAPARDRRVWIGAVRNAAEKAGLAWTYWTLDQGFGFVADRHDPDSIDYATLTALLLGDVE